MKRVALRLSSVPAWLPLWALLIICETTLQLLMKSAGQSLGAPTLSAAWLCSVLRSPRVIAAGACYIGTFSSWMLILKRTPLSLAFPATAVSYVSVLLGSHWLFRESVEPWRYAGVALIILGLSFLRHD